eukprot:scaffold24975_cov58-Phaeocystis_antarctica.AAC.2
MAGSTRATTNPNPNPDPNSNPNPDPDPKPNQVHAGNERLLRRLLRDRAPRVAVELGSWLGLCATMLLEALTLTLTLSLTLTLTLAISSNPNPNPNPDH